MEETDTPKGPRAGTRGIVNPSLGRAHFCLTRYPPADSLAHVVHHHWVVEWDLRDRTPFVQELVGHPCVNLVFEPGRALVHGVSTRRSRHHLEGTGTIVGTRFRPGGFASFTTLPMWQLVDRAIPLGEAFGSRGATRLGDVETRDIGSLADIETLVGNVEREFATERRIAAIESFLRARLRPPSASQALVLKIVPHMLKAPFGTRVAEVAAWHGVSERTLQRLFRHYVGVTPKWMLNRYRLHEALERIAALEDIAWSEFALELGYFDQAHFIGDFHAAVGRSPVEYAAACREAATYANPARWQ